MNFKNVLKIVTYQSRNQACTKEWGLTKYFWRSKEKSFQLEENDSEFSSTRKCSCRFSLLLGGELNNQISRSNIPFASPLPLVTVLSSRKAVNWKNVTAHFERYYQIFIHCKLTFPELLPGSASYLVSLWTCDSRIPRFAKYVDLCDRLGRVRIISTDLWFCSAVLTSQCSKWTGIH